MKKESIIGKTFGRLTVLSEAGRSKNRSITYLCQCSCGNQVIIKGTALRGGNNKSCGCLKKEKDKKLGQKYYKDLTDKVLNGIRVIKEVGRTKAHKVKWLCICPKCGKEFTAIGSKLINGSIKHCSNCALKYKRKNFKEFAIQKGEEVAKTFIGKMYGEIEILGRCNELNKKGKHLYLCKCHHCGKTVKFALDNLRHRKTCGCVNYHVTHGLHNHRLYGIWTNMKCRCNNPHSTEYKNYGGRGISVCAEWLQNFKVFYDWAVTHGYKDNLTIERIDVNGNYCPDNCTWIPFSEQGNNTRRNVKFTYNGKTLNIAQWSELYNVSRETVKRAMSSSDFEEYINNVKLKRLKKKN